MTYRPILLTAALWTACVCLSFDSLAADRPQSRTGWRPTKAILVSGDQPDDSGPTELVVTQVEDEPDSTALEAPGKASVSDSPPTEKSKTPSKKSPAVTPSDVGGADASQSKLLEGEDAKPEFKLPFSDAAWSWVVGGKDPSGIGFFSLEDKPNKDFNFTDTDRFDVEFHPAIHFVSGPLRTDVPPRLFDLAFGVSFVGEIAPGIGIEANFNLGVFTDFEDSVREGWRFPGRALAFVQTSDETTWLLGIEYLDTEIQQMLPAGGVLFAWDEDTQVELYFPRPKIRHRYAVGEKDESWAYLMGDYRAQAWAIERKSGNADVVSLNEYAVTLGIESVDTATKPGASSFFELGWLFHRKLQYHSGVGDYSPPDALLIRWGSKY